MHELTKLIKDDMAIALGVTEPGAIAFCAAKARSLIGGELIGLNVSMNSGMYKNAHTCCIPNSEALGSAHAAALGFVAGDPDRRLSALAGATPEDDVCAAEYVREGKVRTTLTDISSRIFIEADLKTSAGSARVTIRDSHTNIVSMAVNGKTIWESDDEDFKSAESAPEGHSACAKDTDPDGTPRGTFLSFTMLVTGDNVQVENLTVRNDAGDGRTVGQAVAVYDAGDRSVWRRCNLIVHQDTLFCGPLISNVVREFAPQTLRDRIVENAGDCPEVQYRQYFEDCLIRGDVDFIFGPWRCWFEGCTLYMNARGGWYTAANTPESQPYGFVFHHRRLTGECAPGEGKLGRPWRAWARTLFLACDMDKSVSPRGFADWDSDRVITPRCSEWGTTGARADLSPRHPAHARLTDAEAWAITVEEVLSGPDG